jgi:hypothetical protein
VMMCLKINLFTSGFYSLSLSDTTFLDTLLVSLGLNSVFTLTRRQPPEVSGVFVAHIYMLARQISSRVLVVLAECVAAKRGNRGRGEGSHHLGNRQRPFDGALSEQILHRLIPFERD